MRWKPVCWLRLGLLSRLSRHCRGTWRGAPAMLTVHRVLTAEYLYRNYLLELPSLDFLERVGPESGAAGANRAWAKRREGHPDIRRQEVGELLVCQGLASASPQRARVGIRAIRFGLTLQHADGSFPEHEAQEHSYPGTAFFVGSAASALLMLYAAEWPEWETLRAAWCPPLARSARWLAEQPQHFDLTNHGCAAAGGVSMLSSLHLAEGVTAAAARLGELACRSQNPDASWPERGGTDSLYQAISVIYAACALVTCQDPGVQARLRAAVARGYEWLAEQVADDGAVKCEQNTRKHPDRMRPDNEAITTSDFVAVAYAFRLWAGITGEARWDAVADRVSGWITRCAPGDGANIWQTRLSGTV